MIKIPDVVVAYLLEQIEDRFVLSIEEVYSSSAPAIQPCAAMYTSFPSKHTYISSIPHSSNST